MATSNFAGMAISGVQGGQRRMIQPVPAGMQAIELVRPTADDYDLVEPGSERGYKPFERSRIRSISHGRFPNSGLRTRRQISRACSRPRAGWLETSSHTCRTSDTGIPSRTTLARKIASRLSGMRR